MLRISCAIVFALLLSGCGSERAPVKNKREVSFFNPLINSSEHFENAERKLDQVTLLTSSTKYNMRYVLFDNGKFYYQVEKLGNGTGEWKYRDGYLNLYASRTFFDIDVDLSAAAPVGDAMSFQFVDRFGHNVTDVVVRPPTAMPLRKFSPGSGSL